VAPKRDGHHDVVEAFAEARELLVSGADHLEIFDEAHSELGLRRGVKSRGIDATWDKAK